VSTKSALSLYVWRNFRPYYPTKNI